MTNITETKTMAVVIERDESPLDATERCDSCGAQAFVQVTLSNGVLLFCAHHYKKNQDGLKEKAVTIYDYTSAL